ARLKDGTPPMPMPEEGLGSCPVRLCPILGRPKRLGRPDLPSRGHYFRGADLSAVVPPRACSRALGPGLGLLLVRPDHHDHVPAVLLRLGLDEAQLLDVLGEALQEAVPQLRPGLLTATEHDGDLDLVPRLQEPHDVTLLGLVVVRVDLRSELDLLDDRLCLVPARLPGLHGGLVLVLAVVHELAHGRTRRGRDLDQVEIGLLGELQGILDRDGADLLAVRADEANLRHTDAFVDAGLGADGTSYGCAPRPPPRTAATLLDRAGDPPRKRKAPHDAHAGPPSSRTGALPASPGHRRRRAGKVRRDP